MQKQSSYQRKWVARVFKNGDIKAFKILVIAEDGEQLGIMPRAKALELAEEQGFDLVQMSYDPQEQLCTAKLVDYGKYMYDKKKTEQEKKKKNKSKEQKELKFGYTIWDNDLEMKMRKATEFLKEWHTVRISVVLRWREKVYKQLALEKLQHVEQVLDPVSKSQWVKEEQNWYSLFLFPKKH